VRGVLADLLIEELGSVAINAAHLPVSPTMSVGQFLTGDIITKLEELSPSAGAAVGIPSFDGHPRRAEVASDIDLTCESHVVGVAVGAEAGELQGTASYGGTSNEDAGIPAD